MAARSAEHLRLGKRIRKLREDAGFSQEGFALDAGLDRTYIGGVERGERNPSFEILLRIARRLDVSLTDLVRGIR